MIHEQQMLLGLKLRGQQAGSIIGYSGEAARREAERCAQTGEAMTVGAPEGAGLHVWQGSIEITEDAGQLTVSFDGEWRRATSADLDTFGMPLSEAVEARPVEVSTTDGFCCSMRRKFLPGIVGEDPAVPTPVELADHVLHWGKPIVFAMSYCPFCGKKRDHTQVLRWLGEKVE